MLFWWQNVNYATNKLIIRISIVLKTLFLMAKKKWILHQNVCITLDAVQCVTFLTVNGWPVLFTTYSTCLHYWWQQDKWIWNVHFRTSNVNSSCVPSCVLMHYSMLLCSINYVSSVFTLKIPKRKRCTLNTRMMHLNNQKMKCGILDTSCNLLQF